MQSSCSNFIYIYLLARNCYYNLKPNFWSHCFNSPELKAQVRYDNEYIDGLLLFRVPTVREKSVKNEKNSRSGKSQGILSWVREI